VTQLVPDVEKEQGTQANIGRPRKHGVSEKVLIKHGNAVTDPDQGWQEAIGNVAPKYVVNLMGEEDARHEPENGQRTFQKHPNVNLPISALPELGLIPRGLLENSK